MGLKHLLIVVGENQLAIVLVQQLVQVLGHVAGIKQSLPAVLCMLAPMQSSESLARRVMDTA